VGQNGSGKTTIIECLKMATTGDLPPNCKGGQAFINDPHILGVAEVKAQIMLKFRTQIGKDAVCQRSFALTQKAQKREYKAFESALQTRDARGEQCCLSYKCAWPGRRRRRSEPPAAPPRPLSLSRARARRAPSQVRRPEQADP
jgi:DNA repair protein RAD50